MGSTESDSRRDFSPRRILVLGDVLRPDVAETLRYFEEQGVAVKVISGDDPRTVGAIAGRLGLRGADRPVDARNLSDDVAALGAAVEDSSVIGRVSPNQKRAMVLALEDRGHTVAMIGDGVNDALALKEADIGVAMGSGSDASRAVAQVVLLDSDFGAMPQVVAEGRRVLGNIERDADAVRSGEPLRNAPADDVHRVARLGQRLGLAQHPDPGDGRLHEHEDPPAAAPDRGVGAGPPLGCRRHARTFALNRRTAGECRPSRRSGTRKPAPQVMCIVATTRGSQARSRRSASAAISWEPTATATT